MRQFRKERVASLIREILSDAITNQMNDPRVAPLTSITRVELSKDMLIANVFLTVYGNEAGERNTLRAIQHGAGFLQRAVAKELSLRHCPELRFEIDESLKRASQTMAILDENRREHPELFQDSEPEGEDGILPVETETDDESSLPPRTPSEGLDP